MPLLESVLLKMRLSQPFRHFLNELLVLLLIVPGRATFRNRGSKPKTAEFFAILQNQWVMFSVTAMFGNQYEM